MLLSNPYKYTFLPSFLPSLLFLLSLRSLFSSPRLSSPLLLSSFPSFPFLLSSPRLSSPPLPSFFLPSLRCFSSSPPLLQIFPFFLCCPSPSPSSSNAHNGPGASCPSPLFLSQSQSQVLLSPYPFLYVFSPNSLPFLLHPSPIPFSPSYVRIL